MPPAAADPRSPQQEEEEKEDDILSSCAMGMVSGLLLEALEEHVGEGIFTVIRDEEEIEEEDLVEEVTSKLGLGTKVSLDQESIETGLQEQDMDMYEEDDYEEVHSLVSDDEWEEQDRAEQAQSCLSKALSFAQESLRGPTATVQEAHAAPAASMVAKTVAHEAQSEAKAVETPAPATKDEVAARQRPQPLEEQAPTAATLSVPPAAQASIVERHPAAPLSPASPSLTKKARRTIFGGVVRAPKSEEVTTMGGRAMGAPSSDAGQSSPTWAAALRVPVPASAESSGSAAPARRAPAAPAPSAMALDLGEQASPVPPRGGRKGSSAESSSSSSFSRNFSNFTKKTPQVEFKFSQKSESSFAPMPPQGMSKSSKDNGFLPALAGKSVPAGSVAWSVRMAKVGMSSWDTSLSGIF